MSMPSLRRALRRDALEYLLSRLRNASCFITVNNIEYMSQYWSKYAQYKVIISIIRRHSRTGAGI